MNRPLQREADSKKWIVLSLFFIFTVTSYPDRETCMHKTRPDGEPTRSTQEQASDHACISSTRKNCCLVQPACSIGSHDVDHPPELANCSGMSLGNASCAESYRTRTSFGPPTRVIVVAVSSGHHCAVVVMIIICHTPQILAMRQAALFAFCMSVGR